VRTVVESQHAILNGIDMRENPDALAQLYEQLSLPAKRFARLMGDADRASAKEQRYLKPSKSIFDDILREEENEIAEDQRPNKTSSISKSTCHGERARRALKTRRAL